MHETGIIDPRNLPMWVAVVFVVALLALVLAFVGVHRANAHVAVTQAQVLSLSQRIDALSSRVTPPAAPVATATPTK